MTTTLDTTTITVELPEAFDPRWNRLPGITVDGTLITIDPAEHFFRFENSSWLVIDWQTVKDKLLAADETRTAAVEQMALDFIAMLRQAATLMALNKVELDGHISNIGPCWFFPSATGVVFDLSEADGQMLDEVYHGGWFNEHRRIEGIKAHTALGGRLVHGCQSVPDQSGGVVAAYGTSMADFGVELAGMKSEWIEQVESQRVTAA